MTQKRIQRKRTKGWRMMAWEPVEKYVRQENFNLGDNIPHRRVIQTEIIGRHVTMKDNDGVEMMNLLPQGYALCRQVPDGGVIVTHDQLVLMQEAMRFAWEGFGLRPQYDQTAARMQRLDNWIGEMLTQMKGGE